MAGPVRPAAAGRRGPAPLRDGAGRPLLPVFAWVNLFGGQITDKAGTGGDLTVVTHNVNAGNPDPAATARDIVASGADVVALEELAGEACPPTAGAGDGVPVPHGAGHGRAVEQAPADRRPAGGHQDGLDPRDAGHRSPPPTASGSRVYVAHLPSVRVKFDAGFTADQRDGSADALGEAIAAEPVHKVMLLGDLNGPWLSHTYFKLKSPA